MRLQLWNIQACRPQRVPTIAAVIAKHAADTVVLNEVSAGHLAPLRRHLAELGFASQSETSPKGRERGVLIASKRPFQAVPSSAGDVSPECRWCEVWFPHEKIRVAGVYAPSEPEPIAAFWPLIHRAAVTRRDEAFLLLGDLNSGQSILDSEGTPLTGDPWFTAMPFHGMHDLWRPTNAHTREPSWYSSNRGRRNGFRLDRAFGTTEVRSRVKRVWYSHQEREDSVSDHSSLLLELQSAV